MTASKPTETQTDSKGLKFPAGYDVLADRPTRGVFRKAVQVVHSYPLGGDEMTSLDRKVQNAVIVIAQGAFASMSEQRRAMIFDDTIRATPIFKTTISHLESMVESATKDSKRIYDSLRALKRWEYQWDVFEDSPAGLHHIQEEKHLSFMSELGIGSEGGVLPGEITFEIPNTMLRMLVEPKPYAQIELAITNRFKMAAAAALFENTNRYINTNSKHTGKLPLEHWIALLSGEGKYAGKYADFKRYVLEPAMEILEATPAVSYTLELLPTYGPRKKVVALQFKLHMKQQQSLLNEPPPAWPSNLFHLLKDVYKQTPQQLDELAKSGTAREIEEACRREAAMFLRKQAEGTTIEDRGKYMKGILRNLQAGKGKNEEPELEPDESVHVELRTEKSEAELRQEFHGYQLRQYQERLAEFTDADLDTVRKLFAAAHTKNATVNSWIDRGWKRAPNPLNSMLVGWLLKESPEWTSRLVTEADIQFDAWLQRRQQALMVA